MNRILKTQTHRDKAGGLGFDAPKTTLRVPPVPGFWGPGKLRISIGTKKPKLQQGRPGKRRSRRRS